MDVCDCWYSSYGEREPHKHVAMMVQQRHNAAMRRPILRRVNIRSRKRDAKGIIICNF